MTALDALKAHLNIVDDTDDELLNSKLDAAVAHTSNMTGGDDPLTWDTAPVNVQQAILMLAAHWYENREATLIGVAGATAPFGYNELLLAHRNWVF